MEPLTEFLGTWREKARDRDLALDPQGYPGIASYDKSNHSLRYIRKLWMSPVAVDADGDGFHDGSDGAT